MRVKKSGMVVLFLWMTAMPAFPVFAADIMAMAKEAIGTSSENGAEQAPKAVQNVEEEEFSGFTDFFQPAVPKGEALPANTSEGVKREDANVTLPAMTVTGIVWGTKQPRAIINSEVYGEGDIVKDTEAQVKKISEEGILFLYKNKEFLMKRSQLDRAGSGEGA